MTDKCAQLTVIDNTGAELVNLFNIAKKKTLRVNVGDIVKVSVTEAIPNCAKAPRGSVHSALVTTVNKHENGMRFSKTTVVLLVTDKKTNKKSKEIVMLGTRVNGYVSKTLQNNPLFKNIVSKAEGVY